MNKTVTQNKLNEPTGNLLSTLAGENIDIRKLATINNLVEFTGSSTSMLDDNKELLEILGITSYDRVLSLKQIEILNSLAFIENLVLDDETAPLIYPNYEQDLNAIYAEIGEGNLSDTIQRRCPIGVYKLREPVVPTYKGTFTFKWNLTSDNTNKTYPVNIGIFLNGSSGIKVGEITGDAVNDSWIGSKTVNIPVGTTVANVYLTNLGEYKYYLAAQSSQSDQVYTGMVYPGGYQMANLRNPVTYPDNRTTQYTFSIEGTLTTYNISA